MEGQPTGDEWHIYASVNCVIISSDNGLSLVRYQAIISTSTALFLTRPPGTTSVELKSKYLDFHVKNENAICKMPAILSWLQCVNTLRPRQNGRHFADDTFKRIFLNDNVRISIKISMKFVPKGHIINISALVQIMAWRRLGDKPLSEHMRHSASMS